MASVYENAKLHAREQAGQQALGLVGRSNTGDFKEMLTAFKEAYEFLKAEFEAAIDLDVADTPD